MTTLADLVAEVHSSLHSYTGIQEQVTWLSADVTAGDLTLPVASTDGVIRGVAEVGDELVYVFSADNTGANLAPFGRGYRGTAAASHSANDQMTVDPMWPRYEIKRSINQAISSLFPTLYRVKAADLTLDATTVGYQLPDDVEDVLRVEWRAVGDPFNYWGQLYSYDVDVESPSGGGKVLNLYDTTIPGSACRVVYKAKFGVLVNDADTLESVGLTDNHIDLIVYAVAARMIRFLDPARLQITSVENVARGQLVAAGDAGKIANQMYAMYQQRLTEERRRLITSIPPSMNFTL